MNKVIRIEKDGVLRGYMIDCPGCESAHLFDTRWKFNGDLENPTFQPSLKATWPNGGCCHFFVTAGKIRFLSDCSHDKKGLIMDLPNME